MSAGASEAHGNGKAGAAEAARRARRASRRLAVLSDQQRNDALLLAAERLEEGEGQIVAANAEDLRAAEPLLRAGAMSQAMLARLRVSERPVAEMAEKVRSVARLP